MRKLRLIPFLTILVISLLVSLSFIQSAYASPEKKLRWKPCWFVVSMHEENYAYTQSNLRWMREWNMHPIGPWVPGPMVVEDWIDGAFYCHGDWCMVCELEGYDGIFRYIWWIFWETSPYEDPSAECLGGYFTFSEGTGVFSDMRAFGKAWVTWHLEDGNRVLDYQIHIGLIRGAP